MTKGLSFKNKLFLSIKRQKKKTLRQALLALVILAISAIVCFSFFYAEAIVAVEEEKNLALTLNLVGNIELNEELKELTEGKGLEYLLAYINPYFQASDHIIGPSKFFALDSVQEPLREPISFKEFNGLKLALFRLSEKELTAMDINYLRLIEEAKVNADLAIVYLRWEVQNQKLSTQQVELARKLADSGADLIIGQGQLSKMEVYRSSLIFYGLGNLLTTEGWSFAREGALVNYKLYQDKTVKVEVIPLWIKQAQPRPQVAKINWYRREKVFRQLTAGEEKPWVREGGKLVLRLKEEK